MTVNTAQRFTKERPCPVCGGYDKQQRNQGKRCYGFRSADEEWAHCTRGELAGGIPMKAESDTYAHRLVGDCHCGVRHDPAPPDPQLSGNVQQARRIVATYDYCDEDGILLFQVIRFDPKGFSQRRPDGAGGWEWNLQGVRRVLYRLPELLAADPAKPVFIVEGEKDADNLIKLGLVATTNPMGAKKWLPEYSGYIEDRHVVIVPDNDKDGAEHVPEVAYSAHGATKSVRVLELAGLPDHGDVSDWLEQGHTADELMDLARRAPEWEPSELSPANEIQPNQGFRFTSLSDLLAEPPEAIDYIWDKTLPAGGVSFMAAKPKVGKSTTARCLALAVAKGEGFLGRSTSQGPVVYLALEEKRSEVQAHFSRMGALDEEIYLHFGSSPEDALHGLEAAITTYKPALVIIDPLMRFIRVRDSNDYTEMTRAMEPLMTMARVSGAHILCVHHAGKGDREGGDSILGSTAIFGSVDTALIMRKKGAGRTLESIQRYGEDLPETVIGLDVETGVVSGAGTLAGVETAAAATRIIKAIGDGAMTQNEIRESVEGATTYKITALHMLHKNGDLHRNGSGKKGDPFTYSNVKMPGVGEEDKKGGFPVPAIYGELENWKNQNNFMPEAGVARDQQAASDSGFPEPETVTVERPEPGAVEEGEI